MAEAFKPLADNRAAFLAIELDREFILRTFKHVIYLPVAFFSKRASGVVARQIDQSDNVAPIFTAGQRNCGQTVQAMAILVHYAHSELRARTRGDLHCRVVRIVSWQLTPDCTRRRAVLRLWDEMTSRCSRPSPGSRPYELTHGEYEESRTLQAASEAYSSYMRRTRAENRYSYLQDGVIALSKACVLGVGGLKAIEHQLTPGDVVMFLAYLDRLYAPIEGLTGLYTALQQHVVSVRRAQRLLEEPGRDDASRPRNRPGHGRFENSALLHAYRPFLDVVSFTTRRSENGPHWPSGAGNTVTDLHRLYRPQTRDLIDDQRLSQSRPRSDRLSAGWQPMI